MVSASQLLARLSQLSSWTEVPDTYTPAELSEFYGLCIQRIVFDGEAQTLTVLWLPAMARILHQASWSVDMRKGSRR